METDLVYFVFIQQQKCNEPIFVLWYYWILKELQTIPVWKVTEDENTKYLHRIAVKWFFYSTKS